MKQIAICDDEPQVLAELSNYIKNEYAAQNPGALQVSEYTSATQLICSGKAFDLVILDIQMPGINGMEAAKRLRVRGAACPIIFLTALKDYVFDAFEVDAVNYLLKPVDKNKLFRSISKVLQAETSELLIKQGHDYRKVRIADILYLEAMGRKASIHLKNETLEYYQKFKELPAQLGDGFALPHRSFLVNLDHVKALDGNDAIMDNGDRIPVAKGKKEELAGRLLQHFQKDTL